MLCIEFHEQQNQGKCKKRNKRSRKKGTVEPKSQKKVRQPNAVYLMNMRMLAYALCSCIHVSIIHMNDVTFIWFLTYIHIQLTRCAYGCLCARSHEFQLKCTVDVTIENLQQQTIKKSCPERRIARPLLNLQLWIHFVYTSEETLCTNHTLCKMFVLSSTTFIDRDIQYERKKNARVPAILAKYVENRKQQSIECTIVAFFRSNRLIYRITYRISNE